MPACRYNVRIGRWEVYLVPRVVAATPAEAEERALEIYEDADAYNFHTQVEHVDGGVDYVQAEADDEE